mgnify:CR=1 FL=1
MKFYKANKKGSGAAMSFSFNPDPKNGGIFAELLKQKSWNDANRTGSFDTKEENKIRIKFSVTEIAEMLYICLRHRGNAKFFHKTPSSTCQISFGTYPLNSTEPRGIALSAKKGDNSISVPLSFPEATYLGECFRFFLQRGLAVEQKQQEVYFANKG